MALRGAAAAIIVGAIGMILVDSVRMFGGLLTLLVGFVVAEAVGAATNRRRGPTLGWIAAVGCVAGMVLGRGMLVMLVATHIPFMDRIGVALSWAVSTNVLTGLMILVAGAIAYYRLRV